MNKAVALLCLLLISSCLPGQTASFTYKSINNSYCNPDTVQFTSTSTGSPVGYIWNFGNGRNSHSVNPSVIYSSPGTYTVKLLVVYAENTAQVTNTIVINPAIDSTFLIDKKDLCITGVVNFTAAGGANVESYNWDFGDGSPISSSANKSISHDYSKYGTFTANLTIRSTAGCVSSSSQVITIKKPVTTGTVSATQGCIPAAINFKATVATLPGDPVTSYVWKFDDGSADNTTAAGNISHSYINTGSYKPIVEITTAGGCTNTFKFGTVAFGIPPTNLNAYTNNSTFCASDSAIFIAKAKDANFYIWDNGESIDTVLDTVYKHKYQTLGNKTISVIPSFNGCLGVVDSFNISVIGVISNFTFANKCADKKTFSFRNKSLGNLTSIIWDFGDGSPKENTLNVIHTFPDTGTYAISLIVSDSIAKCSDTFTESVHTSNPSFINPTQSVCKNSSSTFIVLNQYYTSSTIYRYSVLGKKVGILDDTLELRATMLGTFDNYVVIYNSSSYCQDTVFLNHSITVKGPVVNFTSKDSICLSTLLEVTNNSKPFIPGETIVTWDWNFGDGSVHDSTSQPPPHEYSNPGIYTVSLTATDINGCTDVFKKTVSVSDDAFIYLLPRTDTLCSGQADTLIAYRNDPITWSPANFVSCATCDTILVNPTQTTTFYATSSNAFGCTARDSVLVKVYNPFTATTPARNLYICLNESVQLDVAPPGYKILWSPANGLSNPNVYAPMASPISTTTYTATLSDSVGCFTSSVDVIVHLKTTPTVDAGLDKFYPYNSAFTISPAYSNNIVSYLWSPGDQLNCTTCPSPSGTITQKQTYTIEVTSDSGCVAKDDITIFVECKDANLLLPTAFTPNKDNLNDVFYPITRGVSTILSFSIFNREGHLIYQKKNFPPNDRSYGWDGSFKGARISTSVFVYVLEALCDSGERLSKRGSVVLIR